MCHGPCRKNDPNNAVEPTRILYFQSAKSRLDRLFPKLASLDNSEQILRARPHQLLIVTAWMSLDLSLKHGAVHRLEGLPIGFEHMLRTCILDMGTLIVRNLTVLDGLETLHLGSIDSLMHNRPWFSSTIDIHCQPKFSSLKLAFFRNKFRQLIFRYFCYTSLRCMYRAILVIGWVATKSAGCLQQADKSAYFGHM